jgi:hypothetical protein
MAINSNSAPWLRPLTQLEFTCPRPRRGKRIEEARRNCKPAPFGAVCHRRFCVPPTSPGCRQPLNPAPHTSHTHIPSVCSPRGALLQIRVISPQTEGSEQVSSPHFDTRSLIKSKRWRQFSPVRPSFHPPIALLVGTGILDD